MGSGDGTVSGGLGGASAATRRISGIRTVVVGAGWRNYVFVLIDTDDGFTGLGEASLGGQTNAVLGALKDLEPLLLGADAIRIEHLWQQAYRHAFWHGGPTFLSALAGVEVALWDIQGQALGVPIHRLLGGPVRERIRAYANGPRGETPEEMARSAVELVARGFTALKMAPWEAMPILASQGAHRRGRGQGARRARGGRAGNRAHGRCPRPALATSRRPCRRGPRSPRHYLSGGAHAAGERCGAGARGPQVGGTDRRWGAALHPLGLRRGCSPHARSRVLQPDIIQSGGIAEARKIAALAEMHFVSVAPHNPWSWVNTMASLHLDAVLPNFLLQEVITEPEPWKDAIVINPPRMDEEGFFAVPSAPGLGITLDLEAAKRFPPVVGPPAGPLARRRLRGRLVMRVMT